MNKWEDTFNKSQSSAVTCNCSSNQGLFVPNRQLSFIVAGLLFLFFTIFMAGYFWGKKTVVEPLVVQMEQDAFADQIYTSVVATGQIESQNEELITDASLVTGAEILESPSLMDEKIALEDANNSLENNTQRYYAQLIGFGTEKAAQMFAKKLATKGIDTEVRKRTSTTAKGRVSYWYQVVTNSYSDKNELLQLVDRIAKEENIKDANIRTC